MLLIATLCKEPTEKWQLLNCLNEYNFTKAKLYLTKNISPWIGMVRLFHVEPSNEFIVHTRKSVVEEVFFAVIPDRHCSTKESAFLGRDYFMEMCLRLFCNKRKKSDIVKRLIIAFNGRKLVF